MRVRLLAFASASDVVGSPETELELSESATVATLKTTLQERHPGLEPLWDTMAIAVNGELAGDTTAVEHGDEVALLPPVSGGSETRAVLQTEPIDLEEVVSRVEDPSCGALIVFVGNVRNHHAGRPVRRITYSAYEKMAERRIRTICSELEDRHHRTRVAVVHRLGEIEVGAASVVIVSASAHRATAYDASREALERLKAEVPIWKREHYGDGESSWREEESLVTSPDS